MKTMEARTTLTKRDRSRSASWRSAAATGAALAAALSLTLVGTPVAHAGDGDPTEARAEQMEDDGRLADFETYDVDDDGELEGPEFRTLVQAENWFRQLDSDENQEVLLSEFLRGAFLHWDVDRDGFLDEGEHRALTASLWNGDSASFSDLDGDGDGKIDQGEFATTMVQHESFSRWDTNGNDRLSAQEYSAALVDAWDRDGDDQIDQQEFAAIKWH